MNVNISHSDENHPNSNFIRNEKGQGCIDGSRMKYDRSFFFFSRNLTSKVSDLIC